MKDYKNYHELRLQCLEIAVKTSNGNATSSEILKFAQEIYDWVTKK